MMRKRTRQILSDVDALARRALKRAYRKRPQKSIQEKFPQYDIGRGTYGIPKIRSWGEGASLRIGSFCSIADGVQIILGGEHRTEWVTTYPFSVLWGEARHIEGHPKTRGDVVIGNDVWLGREATVLSGVHVGDGAVVAARALVTRDVPPYAVAAGNPAQIVKQRFADDEVEQLLELRWWDWDDETIKRHLPLMLSEDLSGFLLAAREEKYNYPPVRVEATGRTVEP